MAHWLEPSIHKQLLISTNRVQIKKTTEKGKGGKKIRIKTNRRVQIKEKYDFLAILKLKQREDLKEKGMKKGDQKEKGKKRET